MIETLFIWVITHSTTFWTLVLIAWLGYLVGSVTADESTEKDRKALQR